MRSVSAPHCPECGPMTRHESGLWGCECSPVDEKEETRSERRTETARAKVTPSEMVAILEQVGSGSLSAWVRKACLEKVERDSGVPVNG